MVLLSAFEPGGNVTRRDAGRCRSGRRAGSGAAAERDRLKPGRQTGRPEVAPPGTVPCGPWHPVCLLPCHDLRRINGRDRHPRSGAPPVHLHDRAGRRRIGRHRAKRPARPGRRAAAGGGQRRHPQAARPPMADAPGRAGNRGADTRGRLRLHHRPDGHIVTNRHVVAGAYKITVTLHDGSSFAARVLATNESPDLALLKIDAGHTCPPCRSATAMSCASARRWWRSATRSACPIR